MPSPLRYFGLLSAPQSTHLNTLGITSPLNSLMLESRGYFIINENAEAMQGNRLAITVIENNKFDLNDRESAHTNYLRKCTEQYHASFARLQAIDYKLMSSIIFTVLASALSFIPFVGLLSMVGLGAVLYYTSQRATAYAEYHEALTLMAANCNWALGTQGGADVDELMANEDITNMMLALYPVTTEEQIRHLIADEFERHFTNAQARYNNRFAQEQNSGSFNAKDKNIARSKSGADFCRCVYGLNQGTPIDFFDAFLSILPDLFNWAKQCFEDMTDNKQVAHNRM